MTIPLMYKVRHLRACQLLILSVGKLVFLPVTKRDVSLLEVAPERKHYIIVANHKRALDPFVIICGLPYKQVCQALPIAFMTSNFFYDSFIRPLCWLSGCFPARNPKGKHKVFGVEGSITLLRHGFS